MFLQPLTSVEKLLLRRPFRQYEQGVHADTYPPVQTWMFDTAVDELTLGTTVSYTTSTKRHETQEGNECSVGTTV